MRTGMCVCTVEPLSRNPHTMSTFCCYIIARGYNKWLYVIVHCNIPHAHPSTQMIIIIIGDALHRNITNKDDNHLHAHIALHHVPAPCWCKGVEGQNRGAGES